MIEYVNILKINIPMLCNLQFTRINKTFFFTQMLMKLQSGKFYSKLPTQIPYKCPSPERRKFYSKRGTQITKIVSHPI